MENNSNNSREIFIEETIPMTITEKIKNIFVAPAKVFENVKEVPNINGVLLIVILLTAIVTLLQYSSSMNLSKEIYEKIFLQTGIKMPVISTELTIVTAISTIFTSAISVILGLLVSTFFTWIIAKICGGKAKFMTTFNMLLHVTLLTSIIMLIPSLIKLITGSYIDVFSFAILITPDVTTFTGGLLMSITLYGIWGAILTGIGLSIINNFSKVKGYVISIIMYVFGILVAAGISASTMFMFQILANIQK